MKYLAIALFTWLLASSSAAMAGWRSLPVDRGKAKQQLQPQKLALVVGVNQTQARYWSPLLFAKRDATRMSKTLRTLAGFDQILLRVRKQDTTRPALWKAVQSLTKRIKSPLDTVFVYVSAHGTVAYNPKTKQQERYIVTSDTGKHTAATAINVKRLVSALKATPSRRVVLMLATCYTGTPRSKSRTKAGHKGNLAKAVKPLRDKALQILSASGFAQAAYESTKLKADVYTHFFLDCLRRLKARRKGVSTIDAHTCATKPTTDFVKKHIQEIQVPRVDSRPGTNRDVLLYTRQRKARQRGYFWAGRKHHQVRYEIIPKSRSKGSTRRYQAQPGQFIALAPGRYKVVVRTSQGWHLRSHSIQVHPFRLTQLREENLLTPRQRLRQAERSHRIWPVILYTSSAVVLAGSAASIAYGIVANDKLPQYVGIITGGIGVVWLLMAAMSDVALRSRMKKLRLEAELFSEHPADDDIPNMQLPPTSSTQGAATLLDLQ